MYDTPAEVAEAFLSSLTETIESVDAEDGHSPGVKADGRWGGSREGRAGEPECLWGHAGEQQKRKIVLDPSGSMNIYLVLDGSDSIGARNFTGAKNCLRDFIEKVEPLFQCADPEWTSQDEFPSLQPLCLQGFRKSSGPIPSSLPFT